MSNQFFKKKILLQELIENAHKFMATLTEAANAPLQKTVLYIPREKISSRYSDAVKEKDLIQRLESTVIFWTRQVKKVISNYEGTGDGEDAGPLAEIAFWRSRSIDLGGIKAQLDKPEVEEIIKVQSNYLLTRTHTHTFTYFVSLAVSTNRQVLERARSSYLEPFLDLSNIISSEAFAAENNLKYLLILQEICSTLSESLPRDIPDLLPDLLTRIRMIWNTSRFYSSAERLCGLLRKVPATNRGKGELRCSFSFSPLQPRKHTHTFSYTPTHHRFPTK